MKFSDVTGLLFLGVALEGTFLALRGLEPFDQHVPGVIALALAAGLLYLMAVYRVLRSTARPDGRSSGRDSRATLLLILVAAIVFRLTLIGAAPTLSDDLYRYQWEGRIQAAAWNPYLVTPADPELAALRDPNFARAPGQHVPTAYPPLAELYFYGLVRVGGGLEAFNWAALGLDLAALALVLLLLRVRGEPLARVLIYAWCPLVVLEFAGNGHYDALAFGTLLLANLFIIRQRPYGSIVALAPYLSGMGLAAATLSKWFAGLLLPVFLAQAAPKHWWRWLAGFAGAGLLITLPYLDAGRHLVSGLVAYGEQWRNNESLFRLLSWATQRDDVAAGLALGVVVGLAVYAMQARTDPLRASYWVVGAILLLSPSVFPWYVTWLVPFLCFFPNPAGLLFTVTVLLSYHVVLGYRALGVWEYEGWLVALEYLPVYGLLLWRLAKRLSLEPRIHTDEHG
ncbi:MAG: glycosyltransferase 87 family protein [Terriglobia bacterium]